MSQTSELLLRLIQSKRSDCILWPMSVGSHGYPQVSWEGKNRTGHRLACEWTYGPPPTESHQAAHSCGVRKCVNPEHLRWATASENQADRVQHGTANRGEKCGAAKLNEKQVEEIRRRYSEGGILQRELATEFSVTQPTVSRVLSKTAWSPE